MSLHRQAAQRDANEAELVRALRKCGFRVQLHSAWDLDLLCLRCKRVTPVEVKTAKGTLTVSQKKLLEEGWPLVVMRSTKDVGDWIAAHVKGCLARE